MRLRIAPAVTLLLALLLTTCSPSRTRVLRMATTTSTYDSGLLDAILPAFEIQYDAEVEVIAVGTGQALALGERGDVDIILVHARLREEAFISEGFGLERIDVMYNDFILVGPKDDPAGVRGMPLAGRALGVIAAQQVPFASRGDDSGTHIRELQLWEMSGSEVDRELEWYYALGQGMGDTLLFAHERLAYTLTDRGTFLALRTKLGNLEIMVGGRSIDQNMDPDLRNPYGLIPVNPALFPDTAETVAQAFVQWLTSLQVQEQILAYGLDMYGQPLFYPNSDAWREAHP